MIDNTLAIGAIVAAALPLIAIGKVWLEAGVTKQKAASAAQSSHEAHQRLDALVTDLGNFKAQASRDFATPGEIAAAESRFAEAVNGMRSDFRDMSRRLDGLLVALKQV